MSLPTTFFIGRGGAVSTGWANFTLLASIGANSHSGPANTIYNGANLTSDSVTASHYYANYDTTTNPWFLDPAVYSIYRAGFQKLTVPKTGTYRIRCYGTSGCTSGTTGPSLITATKNSQGKGAIMQAEFTLTEGQFLYCVVAKQAEVEGTGGGATFVQLEPSGTPLIVAGGGGGNYGDTTTNYSDTQDDTRGGPGESHPNIRAVDGNGGDANTTSYGGGGGYYGAGINGSRDSNRLRDSALGSDFDATYKGAFGGGAGAIGGGGGYSGGAGANGPFGPGYGGSFISATCTGQNVGNITGQPFIRTGTEPDVCYAGTPQLSLGRNTLPYGKIEITAV
jgi:hypothetical protein